MFDRGQTVAGFDEELEAALSAESRRQEAHIELIASENYVSPRVLEVQGSVLTNKYAEGYPAKRYYGGCEHVDVAEQLAIDRAKALFGADYANVQPHSGSQANAAVYMALCAPGDTILGMSLDAGGHLTHGSPPPLRHAPIVRQGDQLTLQLVHPVVPRQPAGAGPDDVVVHARGRVQPDAPAARQRAWSRHGRRDHFSLAHDR